MRSYIVAAFVFSILSAGAPALAAPTLANKATDKAMPPLEHAFDCMGKAIAHGQTGSFTRCLPTSTLHATAAAKTLAVNMRRATSSYESAPSESSATSALESDATRPTTIAVKRHEVHSDTIDASIETSTTASETITAVVRRATAESLSSSTVTVSDAAEPADVVVKRQGAALTYAVGVSASAAMSMSIHAYPTPTAVANTVATGMADIAKGVSKTVGAYTSSIASEAAGVLKSVGTNIADGASATMQVGAFGTDAAYLNVDGVSVSLSANPKATAAADMSVGLASGSSISGTIDVLFAYPPTVTTVNPKATAAADITKGLSKTVGPYASSLASGVSGDLKSVGTNMVGSASSTMQVGSFGTDAAFLNVDGVSVSRPANPKATASEAVSVGLVGGSSISGTIDVPLTVGVYASSLASGAAGGLKPTGTNKAGDASATVQVGAFGTDAAYLNVDGVSASMSANPEATAAVDSVGLVGGSSDSGFAYPNPTFTATFANSVATGMADITKGLSKTVGPYASSLASGVSGDLKSVGTNMVGSASSMMQVGSFGTDAAYLNVDGVSISMSAIPTATATGISSVTGVPHRIPKFGGRPTASSSSSGTTKGGLKNGGSASYGEDASNDLELDGSSGMSTGDQDYDSDYKSEFDYALGTSGVDGDDDSMSLDSDFAVSASVDSEVYATLM